MPIQQMLLGAGAAADKLYIEDFFSSYVYTPTDSGTQVLTTKIDLSSSDSSGGIVWLQRRGSGAQCKLWDTLRGINKKLTTQYSSGEDDESSNNRGIMAFSSTGMTVKGNIANEGTTFSDYFAQIIRIQPGLMDYFLYTGDGTDSRNLSHNLGCLPGMVIIKRRDGTGHWKVWMHDGASTVRRYHLNSSMNGDTNTSLAMGYINSADSTNVQVVDDNGDLREVNEDGNTYVCMVFAGRNDTASKIFGEDSDEDVVRSGAYTGNSSNPPDINVGWEPQTVWIKGYSNDSDWTRWDNARGVVNHAYERGGDTTDDEYGSKKLMFSSTGAEGNQTAIEFNPTGFKVRNSWASTNNNNVSYNYIAFRRGDMRTPQSAAKAPLSATQSYYSLCWNATIDEDAVAQSNTYYNRQIDWLLQKAVSTSDTDDWFIQTRQGGNVAKMTGTSYETDYGSHTVGVFDSMGKYKTYKDDSQTAFWGFSKAKGFFDIVAGHIGTGSGTTVQHNLGVKPGFVIAKNRSEGQGYTAYIDHSSAGATKGIFMAHNTAIDDNPRYWNDTEPTSTHISIGTGSETNNTDQSFFYYLFGDIPGVCKMGSYTSNTTNSNVTVDVGFAPRFLLIKGLSTTTNTNFVCFDSGGGRGFSATSAPYTWFSGNNVTGEYGVASTSTGFTINESQSGATTDVRGAGTYWYMAIFGH